MNGPRNAVLRGGSKATLVSPDSGDCVQRAFGIPLNIIEHDHTQWSVFEGADEITRGLDEALGTPLNALSGRS